MVLQIGDLVTCTCDKRSDVIGRIYRVIGFSRFQRSKFSKTAVRLEFVSGGRPLKRPFLITKELVELLQPSEEKK